MSDNAKSILIIGWLMECIIATTSSPDALGSEAPTIELHVELGSGDGAAGKALYSSRLYGS